MARKLLALFSILWLAASQAASAGEPERAAGERARHLAALEARLDGLDEGAVWERRKLVRQIDDIRIEQMVSGSLDYRKITYASSDGLQIPAYLFRPLAASPAPSAAVIYVHGGQHGWFRPRSVKRVRLLIDAGYIVLAPDYRSSSGYSQAFYEAADYGGKEIDDMLAAHDYLAAMPDVDGRRIAILGLSHGGYNSVMALIRAPGKFAAAVNFFGPTDLVWRVTASPDENPNASPGDREYFASMIGATVEEAPELYRQRSPRYLAEQIRDPLMILHGEKDAIVLPQESEWLANALQEAGNQNYSYHVIKNANHGFPAALWDEGWALALDFLQRELAAAHPAD